MIENSEQLIQNIHTRIFTEGEVIFEEGDLSDETMFFLVRGDLSVLKKRQGEQVEIAIIPSGNFFGEIGIINSQPRAATIKVKSSDAKVMLFNKETLFYLTQNRPDFLFNIFKSAIEKLQRANGKYHRLHKQFPHISIDPFKEGEMARQLEKKKYAILDYINGVSTKVYVQKEVIFKEGQISNGAMFFIFEGDVEIIKERGPNGEERIATLKPGDFFGEMALIEDKPRSATARVGSAKTVLAQIDKPMFIKVARFYPHFLYSLLKIIFVRLSIMEDRISQILESAPIL
ncbi:MAG: cyclic nucleotide-binding domain-containing protein [Leptospiraceae bacterium]|nr:cyclic nucleotide-binding domain-containing protein [Leptospiraceae bacterium]MCP5502597.1 cyclic nucleotide-binding domain-containing protein [Leptospiraceae bacterium]